MTSHPEQPRQYDPVLGGQIPPTIAVLGGLAGIKQRLTHPDREQQMAALAEALNYGQSGLKLVIHVLLDAEFANSGQLQQAAYRLLRDRPEPGAQAALRIYNPYAYFECLATYSHDGYSFVRSLILSPDGQTLLSRGDSTVKVWSLKTGKSLATLPLPLDHEEIGASVAELYPHLQIWSLRNGKIEYYSGQKDAHLAFFPNGQTVASCGNDRTIRLWNRRTGEMIDALTEHASQVNAIAISADGQRLVSVGNDCLIKVWDVPSRQAIKTLKGHTNSIWAIAISPNGQLCVSASEDRTIRVWNLHTGEERLVLQGHTSGVSAIALSTDGKILVSGGSDRMVKVWNLQTGQELQTLAGHTHYLLSIALSTDQQRIFSGSRDGTIKVWGMRPMA